MTAAALQGLRNERERVLEVARTLTPAEWTAPSDCAGWRVQDVVAHMAAVYRGIAAPGSVASAGSHDAEVNAEAAVDERRGRSPGEVLAEYEEWSATCLDTALAGMQAEPLASTVVPMGNLGSHPLHILANALLFDHYCHLRHDVLAPNGPVQRLAPPQDDEALAEILAWMLGGLPQMCRDGLAVVDRPIHLVFTGAGSSRWVVRPGAAPGDVVKVDPGTADDAAATVTTTAHDFVCWGTRRRDWRACGVSVTGDEAYAAAFLDAVNVI